MVDIKKIYIFALEKHKDRQRSPKIHDAKVGRKQIGCSTPEFTLVENPTMDDILSNEVLKSGGSVKQEVNNEQINLFKF